MAYASYKPQPQDEVQRTTQGFVANLSWVRQRPSLTLIEVAWRWCFGIPALLLIYRAAHHALAIVPWQATGNLPGLNQLLTNPTGSADWLVTYAYLFGAAVFHPAMRLLPVLLLGWAVISGLGRTVLLRRMDGTLHSRPLTLVVLQLVRLLSLAAIIAAWVFGLYLIAVWSISQPVRAGGEPNIMLYVGGVIVLTLTLFVLSAAIGWVFSIAPLLAMIHGTGPARSLGDALRIGGLRGSLVEINLVLGIVKIALIVLAMVFSACPLPFQSVMTGEFLFWWNVAVGAWYLLASDFFHVARVAAYLRLWKATRE